MRVVIPAKADSTRCPEKNWRDFYKGNSLVDILIGKLWLGCNIACSDIYVSSDSQEHLQRLVDTYGVNAMLRDEHYAHTDTPTSDWIGEMTGQFDSDEDVALAHCTTPTFNEHMQVINRWNLGGLTSIAVAQEAPTHLLLQHQNAMQPFAWSMGAHHTISQLLMPVYQMTFSFQIMKGKHWRQFSYYTAPDCHWHITSKPHIDINSEQDFADAQAVYAARADAGTL